MGKKNGSYSRDYGKVVGNNSKDFPGWKGPAFVKKAEPRAAKAKPVIEDEAEPEPEPEVAVELQQNLLNIFRDSFPEVLDSNDLKLLLQEVKTALYERDFTRAFGKEDYLEAYSVRWSPSRALCYQTILVGIKDHLRELMISPEPKSGSGSSVLHAVCFGGGAAEVVGFGGFVRHLLVEKLHASIQDEAIIPTNSLASLSIAEEASVGEDLPTKSNGLAGTTSPSQELDLMLIDCAQWKTVVQKLQSSLITPPTLSKYASASAREANKALLEPNNFSSYFRVNDVLTLDQSQIGEIVGKRPMLMTLLFTLNELYTSSIPKTTAFLLKLTMAAKPGSLLLVVDSPGSYSETTIGNEAKKYPMHWLLNHTLVGTAKANGKENTPDWEKVISDESRWFRIPDGLRYPISLENMRYQIHLYRRV
jgi:25S rRNA (uracil2843-N3)-methyltransferase